MPFNLDTSQAIGPVRSTIIRTMGRRKSRQDDLHCNLSRSPRQIVTLNSFLDHYVHAMKHEGIHPNSIPRCQCLNSDANNGNYNHTQTPNQPARRNVKCRPRRIETEGDDLDVRLVPVYPLLTQRSRTRKTQAVIRCMGCCFRRRSSPPGISFHLGAPISTFKTDAESTWYAHGAF